MQETDISATGISVVKACENHYTDGGERRFSSCDHEFRLLEIARANLESDEIQMAASFANFADQFLATERGGRSRR